MQVSPGTFEIIRSALKADSLVSPEERARFLSVLRYGLRPTTPPLDNQLRVLSRQETASRLGRSLRFVDNLAVKGVIRKVRVPGRTRSIGFVESSVNALISSTATLPIHEGK